jgi:hypothetical protein
MVVGFLITRRRCDTDLLFKDIGVDLNVFVREFNNFYIYICSDEDSEDELLKKNVYSLYESNDLNDRNFKLEFHEGILKVFPDWICSFPIYYNVKSEECSTHYSLIDYKNEVNDNTGIYCLKKFSYIPWTATLNKEIKKLYFNQYLEINEKTFRLVHSQDTYLIGDNGNDVISEFALFLNNSTREKVSVVPLSGGYDSRFILSLFDFNYSHPLISVTYSLEKDKGCFESVVSEVVAEKLGVPHEIYYFDNFANRDKDILNRNYGVSHLNGDYYIQFAEDIINKYGKEIDVYSGIIGDLWSGKIKVDESSDKLVEQVVYSHGIGVYDWMISTAESREGNLYIEEYNNYLKAISSNELLFHVAINKLPVIDFLCYAFERKGVRVVAPFLNKNLVNGVMNLSSELKKDRKWMVDYFNTKNIGNSSLPSRLFKNNLVMLEELKKRDFYQLRLKDMGYRESFYFKCIASSGYRRIEAFLHGFKILDYLFRSLGYKRSDIIFSIYRSLTFKK